MHRISGPILLLSLLALLVLQSAGLHLHANAHTEGMQLHAEHVHDADPDGHDHSADVDVSIFELGTLWAKLVFLLPLLALVLLVPIRGSRLSRTAPQAAPACRSQLRWRPPLRAPPLLA